MPGTWYIYCYPQTDGTYLTLADGDMLSVGPIPWYMDFLFSWGDPRRQKKTRWLNVAGQSTANGTFLRCASFPDKAGRTFTYTNAKESHAEFRDTDSSQLVMLGGMCRSVRVRLSETGNPMLLAATPFPSNAGKIEIFQVDAVADLLDTP